ncbi:diphthine--ammonia ligase [Pedobacter sp. SYSU D00535]|uniref:Dph6-related ATP pyrophosphatase n=1 Tax=Pedobacter sp. SYSU D00535 TaxID=2810308 RepID=UPI001F6130B3|nr:diphthine--ammonia ligase [Pedobacter sp. SYSU D00535]
MLKAAMFWSGGKDSALALYKVLKSYPQLRVEYLVTTISEEFRRISMHGVRESLLDVQAQCLQIPLYKMIMPGRATNEAYEESLAKTFEFLKEQGVSHVIYGDIFLEDLKMYREAFLQKHHLSGIFPLWKQDTSLLLQEFLSLGFKTITCCVSNKYLSVAFLGKVIDQVFIEQLPAGVDLCGENGEYHTFCFDGPLFKKAVTFREGVKEFRALNVNSEEVATEGFWFIDLVCG